MSPSKVDAARSSASSGEERVLEGVSVARVGTTCVEEVLPPRGRHKATQLPGRAVKMIAYPPLGNAEAAELVHVRR